MIAGVGELYGHPSGASFWILFGRQICQVPSSTCRTVAQYELWIPQRLLHSQVLVHSLRLWVFHTLKHKTHTRARIEYGKQRFSCLALVSVHLAVVQNETTVRLIKIMLSGFVCHGHIAQDLKRLPEFDKARKSALALSFSRYLV